MRRDSVIYLVPYITDENSIGDAIKVPGKPRQIFADKKSVRQSEFYQAANTDFKPELVFIIWITEYRGESLLKYKGNDYRIIRTFEKDYREMEIICEGV